METSNFDASGMSGSGKGLCNFGRGKFEGTSQLQPRNHQTPDAIPEESGIHSQFDGFGKLSDEDQSGGEIQPDSDMGPPLLYRQTAIGNLAELHESLNPKRERKPRISNRDVIRKLEDVQNLFLTQFRETQYGLFNINSKLEDVENTIETLIISRRASTKH